jgi:transcriptional regulator with XRE-family HTH domain
MEQLKANIKGKRKVLGLTQEELAVRIGVTRSALGAYEEGRAEPRLTVLLLLADLFGCSIDALLQQDILKTAGQRSSVDVAGKRLRILPVAVQAAGEEQISVVPVQAAAGYLDGHRDTDFVAKLPAFSLPVTELRAERSYRLFQIKGDSMVPVPDGSYIIAEYVQDWRSLRDYQSCILVSKGEGVVYKRVINHLEQGYLELRSDNPAYAPYRLQADEVLEVWKGLGYLSFKLPTPGDAGAVSEWQQLLGELRTLVGQVQGTNK